MTKLPIEETAKEWSQEPMIERADICIRFLYTWGLLTKAETVKARSRLDKCKEPKQ
jgi:hypothetical protein